jgi:hypothetical protein
MIKKLSIFVFFICILSACTQQKAEEETTITTQITIEGKEGRG